MLVGWVVLCRRMIRNMAKVCSETHKATNFKAHLREVCAPCCRFFLLVSCCPLHHHLSCSCVLWSLIYILFVYAGVRHGWGALQMASGFVYSGQWQLGKRTGWDFFPPDFFGRKHIGCLIDLKVISKVFAEIFAFSLSSISLSPIQFDSDYQSYWYIQPPPPPLISFHPHPFCAALPHSMRAVLSAPNIEQQRQMNLDAINNPVCVYFLFSFVISCIYTAHCICMYAPCTEPRWCVVMFQHLFGCLSFSKSWISTLITCINKSCPRYVTDLISALLSLMFCLTESCRSWAATCGWKWVECQSIRRPL